VLENVNLKRKLTREEYKQVMPALQRRLYDLEKACWDQRIPSIVIFEGWDASGKGSCISTLTQRLDPRGFKVHSIQPPRTYEQNYPWLWRFWLKAPNRGEMVILDHSWYHRVLEDRVDKTVPEKTWRKAFKDILEFERMLADDGAVILKFWFHISRKEQKKRFEKISADPLESWRVTRQDWQHHEHYDEFLEAAEEMLELTESEYAPWTIVEATSRWHARRKVFLTLTGALERALGANAPVEEDVPADDRRDAELREAMDTLEHDGNGGE
jgi:polyphosphate kinase 2 (PPK2 family)